ncbi:MAG: hypothetical protein JXQ75_17385 [Phycisphaerae bacterium]|nr:hypothetical protein [Phycisphaerae bacterium]
MNLAARCTAAVLLSCAAAVAQPEARGTADATDVAYAMDQKLDELTISGKELPEALAEIGKQVGVTISVDDRSVELLPWGRQTRLKGITISNASLREALPQILGPLGLTYELRDGGVLAVATEPLKRINRRATWDDLKLLRRCNETKYTPESFAGFKLHYRITRKVDAPALLAQQLARAGRGTIAEMLEVATGSLGWVWFPDGDHLVIRTAQAQIANQLARRVTARYENAPLTQVLLDLADRAEVALLLEPGMMLKLPPSAKETSLVLQHSSIRQALNVISAETGLKYEMRRDLLFIGLADDYQSGGAPAASRRSPYVGRISVRSEDGSYEYDFLLRADELPEDILEYRRQVIDEYIEKMRRDMAPNGAIETSGDDPSPN